MSKASPQRRPRRSSGGRPEFDPHRPVVRDVVLALIPPSRDVIASAYFQHELARIYVLAGEEDKAIALLKTLLRR